MVFCPGWGELFVSQNLKIGLPKETVTAIAILYKITKVKIRSPDGDTYFYDIVRVLQ